MSRPRKGTTDWKGLITNESPPVKGRVDEDELRPLLLGNLAACFVHGVPICATPLPDGGSQFFPACSAHSAVRVVLVAQDKGDHCLRGLSLDLGPETVTGAERRGDTDFRILSTGRQCQVEGISDPITVTGTGLYELGTGSWPCPFRKGI